MAPYFNGKLRCTFHTCPVIAAVKIWNEEKNTVEIMFEGQVTHLSKHKSTITPSSALTFHVHVDSLSGRGDHTWLSLLGLSELCVPLACKSEVK